MLLKIASFCFLLTVGVSGYAQPAEVSASSGGALHEGACREDREKLCPGLTSGEGLLKCMREKEAEQSPSCKGMIESMKEKVHDRREACAADIEKFCKDSKEGGRWIMRCLRQHRSELSPECKAARENRHPRRRN